MEAHISKNADTYALRKILLNKKENTGAKEAFAIEMTPYLLAVNDKGEEVSAGTPNVLKAIKLNQGAAAGGG